LQECWEEEAVDIEEIELESRHDSLVDFGNEINEQKIEEEVEEEEKEEEEAVSISSEVPKTKQI
jgi:hypothetical protein